VKEIILEDIRVMMVEVVGVTGSARAFIRLESKLSTLRGRKFYGCLTGKPENGIYRACVGTVDTDNPDKMGLKEWVIPGGKYLRTKMEDWIGRENEIGFTFKKMSKGKMVDHSRPHVEFYRSQRELFLLLPIK
jgi:DNA gyrase inhibitor GyrI